MQSLWIQDLLIGQWPFNSFHFEGVLSDKLIGRILDKFANFLESGDVNPSIVIFFDQNLIHILLRCYFILHVWLIGFGKGCV